MKILLAVLFLLCASSVYSRDTKAHEDRIAVDGAELYSRDIGQGTPIIILHGGPDFDSSYLLPEMDTLANTFHVIYYDQRGRGRSAAGVKPEDVTLESEMADLEKVRQHFHLDSFVLLGHSWGAVLALEYAVRHPDRISRLVIMNPAPASAGDFQELRREWLEKRVDLTNQKKAIAATPGYQVGDPDAVVAYYRIHFKPALARQEDYEKLIARMQANFIRQGKEGIIEARAVETRLMNDTWIKPGYDLLPSLKSLKVPTLVISGDHEFIPAGTATHITQAIPGARLVTLKNCGHFPYFECPAPLWKELDSFLSKSSSKGR